MMSKGSIDPTKVVRAALQGAASVAGLLITTEAMVAELPQKKGQAIVGRGRHGRNGLLIDPGKQTGGASRSRPFVSVSSESRNPRWIAALYDSEDCASEFSGKIHFTQGCYMATKERLAAMAASLCALRSGAMVTTLIAPDQNNNSLELRTYECAECGHRCTYSLDASGNE
jgi:hypothetical protein